MIAWSEWEPDPESDDEGSGSALVWCWGWTADRSDLVVVLYRLGFADTMGDAYRMVDDVELRHVHLCTEDASGDERTLTVCDGGSGDARPATMVVQRHTNAV